MEILKFFLPKSVIQANTLFISILIEAIPFVLIGVFISSIIQLFVTEDMVSKWMPKNKFLAILTGTLVGILFPACECGIVPITRRLILKGVPLYVAIPFMIAGPIINPIVLFSTYIAFGESLKMMFERAGLAFLVAALIGLIISYIYKNDNQLKSDFLNQHHEHHHSHTNKVSFLRKVYMVLQHAINEFFYMGKYLIFGSLIASSVQVFLPTKVLTSIGHGPISSSGVMMLLSYLLSLCSEADAFVASSFRFSFTNGSIIAFLVFGAMIDVKNTLMMFSTFKTKFVFVYIGLSVLLVLIGSLFL